MPRTPLGTVYGNALQFNGTSQYVLVNADITSAVNNITLTCWIKIIAYGAGDATFVHYGKTDANGYRIQYTNAGLLRSKFSTVGTLSSGATLDVDTWYHIALRRSGGTWQHFVNGVATGSTASTSPFDPDGQNMVGAAKNSAGTVVEYANCILDDHRFYTRALSDGEIADLYNLAATPTIVVSPSSLRLHWKFDENSGNALDSSGNGTTGTLVGSPTRVTGIMKLSDLPQRSIVTTRTNQTVFRTALTSGAPKGLKTGSATNILSAMKWTKDLVTNQQSDNAIDELCKAYARDIGPTHIEVALFMNTNAEFVSAGRTPTPRTLDQFYVTWCQKIHKYGMKVSHRNTWAGLKGDYNFAKKQGGNRYTLGSFSTVYPAQTIFNDDFERTTMGASWTQAADGGPGAGNTWSIVAGRARGPAADGWRRTNLTVASYVNSVTTCKVQKVGHQQIVARATTDSNFPGYGLQLRDGEVWIERPGLQQLATAPKTLVEGNWYWMKLSCIGTSIQGKVWAADDSNFPLSIDGSENEPVSWDISITNATYSSGFAGFSGESSFGMFDQFRVVVPVTSDTTSLCGLLKLWIERIYALDPLAFQNGDEINLITEPTECSPNACIFNDSTSFLAPPQDQSHAAMSINLRAVARRCFDDLGLTGVIVPGFGENWSEISSNYINQSVYDDAHMARGDHYGPAIYPGLKLQGDYPTNGAATPNTYTPTNAINEGATHKFLIQNPNFGNTGYVTAIDVFITDKGTGTWNLVVHDNSNANPPILDPRTLNQVSTFPGAKISNGDIKVNAYNRFYAMFDPTWNNNNYHLHIFTSTGDGAVATVTASDFSTSKLRTYKAPTDVRQMEIDLRKTVQAKGWPVFQGEFSNFWYLVLKWKRMQYEPDFWDLFSRLAAEAKLVGVNVWAGWGEGIEGMMIDQGDGTWRANSLGLAAASYMHGEGLYRSMVLDTNGNYYHDH